MRISLKESRMKLLNATRLDRKFGMRGPKTMGEALRQPFVPDSALSSRPERTRISYFALPETITYAVFPQEKTAGC
jgi:hypothetical protein